MPLVWKPILFYDPESHLLYWTSGQPCNSTANLCFVGEPVGLWGYEPNNSGSVAWGLQANGSTSAYQLQTNIAGGSIAMSSKGPYILGGYKISYNGDCAWAGYDSEMVSYNFGNKSWSNQTLPRSLPAQYYILGEGQYVPTFGSQGVNVFFGGLWPSSSIVVPSDPLAAMSTILVQDIASNQFFTQSAANAPVADLPFVPLVLGLMLR